MILAIDIGNTNIVVGCIDKEKIYFTERISTIRTKTELEYAIDIKTILDIHHINRADIEGAIISSVVPQITSAARLAVQKILKKDAMILGPGVKTGLNIMLDNPGEMGADRVADAVAALAQYVHSFIRDKFFVSFADPVVNAVVFQNIPGEDRFSFIGFDAGWGDGVCCFHIAVAMIYSNDFCVSEFSHKKYLRFRID